MKAEIVVTVSPEGEVQIQVQGHAGPGCADLTRRLETVLGDVASRKKTPEFFQMERNQNHQRT